MSGSNSSLEPHPLEFALIYPLKTSLLSMRSCDKGLDDDRRSNISTFDDGALGETSRRSSRQNAPFCRTDRRKSVSTPAISRLSPSHIQGSGGIPENRLMHQTSLRARSCSPLTRGRTIGGSKGRLSDGSSFGDLMNSGEFRTRGNSIRCCSPIALSMVRSPQNSSDSLHYRKKLNHFPTIAIDSPDEGSNDPSPSASRHSLLYSTSRRNSEVPSLESFSIDFMQVYDEEKPPFVDRDGRIRENLSVEEQRQLHQYLLDKQKKLAQKAMVRAVVLFLNFYKIFR